MKVEWACAWTEHASVYRHACLVPDCLLKQASLSKKLVDGLQLLLCNLNLNLCLWWPSCCWSKFSLTMSLSASSMLTWPIHDHAFACQTYSWPGLYLTRCLTSYHLCSFLILSLPTNMIYDLACSCLPILLSPASQLLTSGLTHMGWTDACHL